VGLNKEVNLISLEDLEFFVIMEERNKIIEILDALGLNSGSIRGKKPPQINLEIAF